MPENENNQKPRKKRGFLWVIIIILIVVLAAVIGGYALAQYYGTPAWLSGFLHGNEPLAAEPSPVKEIISTETPAPVKVIPTPAKPTETPNVAVPEESALPAMTETPAATETPAPVPTATPYIGADAAAEAALKHSKVSEKDADVSSVLLVEQNGMMLYEVCFSTKDMKCEYYLDAYTGRVESWRKTSATVEDAVPASGGLKSVPSPAPTATPEPTPEKKATVLIGEDEAKSLAMSHANISEKELSSIQCKLELEGLKLIYDIEMKTRLMEYDYEIDAVSGDIVNFEVEQLRK